MWTQLKHLFALQSWLRVWDSKQKHRCLGLRLTEVLDSAMIQGMDIDNAWLFVTNASIGLSLKPPWASGTDYLAAINLSQVPSFQEAHRLLNLGHTMEDETPITDAVEKVFDDLASEILRQIYGPAYVRKLEKRTALDEQRF